MLEKGISPRTGFSGYFGASGKFQNIEHQVGILTYEIIQKKAGGLTIRRGFRPFGRRRVQVGVRGYQCGESTLVAEPGSDTRVV